MTLIVSDKADLREALLALTDTGQRLQLLRTVPKHELMKLRHDWGFWRRRTQAPPVGDWRFWLALSGRGWGKTRTGSEYVRQQVESGRASRVGLFAKTPADARDVMIEGPSGLIAVAPPSMRPLYEPSKRRLTWPNGATATIFSSENPDQARGPEHDLVWGDELASWEYADATFENLDFGLRRTGPYGDRPHAIFTTTPRPIKVIKDLIASDACVVVRGSTYDNAGNLDPHLFARIRATYEGTRIGRQEIHAEVLEDVEGALWTNAGIDGARVFEHPPLPRLGISIDPAITSHVTSNETGIIVVGGGDDGHGYVLEDLSCRMSPGAWAKRAVDAFWDWQADEIIAEGNQGGDLVKQTILTIDPRVPVKIVHVRRGKYLRAEPVAALYEQGRVHHVGGFAKLESQMTEWAGRDGEESPDRLDALVQGVAAIMLDEKDALTVGFV